MKFINRKEELKQLNNAWKTKKPQFYIIYGKRRVGKTELVKQFIKNKPSIYYLADKTTTLEQLKEIGKLVGLYFNDPILASQGFPRWLDVFDYLKKHASKPFVFAIDEYPYLVETDNSISSVFQKGWDEYLRNSKVNLILSGSSVSMMESETLIYKSPLYGRRTGSLFLKPLDFFQSWKFFPKKKFEEFLSIYTITGGMPAYLLQILPDTRIEENIIDKIFTKTEFLHNEIEFILKEELREPRKYLAILKAISWGKNKVSEISTETALETNILPKYLGILEKLQLIEREVPVTEKNPAKVKGIYKIADYFTRFWFQYVFPYKSYLEIGNYNEVLKKYRTGFPVLVCFTYENVAKEIIIKNQNKFFPFERIGKWWNKSEEIDIVALNNDTKEIIFGEVKWSNKKVGTNIYETLKRRAQLVDWNIKNRKEYFTLFSKAGFTKDMLKLAKKENVFLFKKDKLCKNS